MACPRTCFQCARPVVHLCPRCATPVPANEWTAYGRHEDCHAFNVPGFSAYPSSGNLASPGGERRGLIGGKS